MVTKHLLFAIFCYLSIFSHSVFAQVTASVDRSNISIDETFQLTISLDETSVFDEPDTSPLTKDFTIVNQQKSSQSSWINGKSNAVTKWVYQLEPKEIGIFTIPSIEVDGEKTQAITVQISPSKYTNSSNGNLQAVFMEATTNKSSVFVQEQLILTLRINSSINLHNIQLEKLNIENAFIVELSNTNYERRLNNTPYVTYEIVFAVFPQASGTLNIPGISAVGIDAGRDRFNSMFGGGQKVRLQSKPIDVDIKEIPSHLNGNIWLPSKSLRITETWSANPDDIKVGDSITRTITTIADGLSAEQLPPINMQAGDFFKIYPDQANLSDTKNNTGIVGVRKDSITIVATKAGAAALPPISIQWWDIENSTLKTETLPAVTLNIAQNGTASTNIATNNKITLAEETINNNNATSATNITGENNISSNTNNLFYWQLSTAISAFIASIFIVLYFFSLKKISPAATKVTNKEKLETSYNLQTLKNACKNKDIATIRSALLSWAKAAYPNNNVHSLTDLTYLLKDEEIKEWINTIDANLYTSKKHDAKWTNLYQLIADKQIALNEKNHSALEKLYPN
jgi:hypothetical protein